MNKKTFENDPGKYQEFMDILNSRLSENKSTDEVSWPYLSCERVQVYLHGGWLF
jgi:hypothetical protein